MMVIMCNDEYRMNDFEYGYDWIEIQVLEVFILKWMEVELEGSNNSIIDNCLVTLNLSKLV